MLLSSRVAFRPYMIPFLCKLRKDNIQEPHHITGCCWLRTRERMKALGCSCSDLRLSSPDAWGTLTVAVP